MALFGVPAALERAPQQAINAAIEMRNAIAELNRTERLPVRLDMHIGVNTGLVIAGNVGGDVKQEFTVVGDAVNLASRLKDAAPNGSIWVGPDTHRYAREEFEFKKLPAVTVKGKERPIDAYEVTSTESIYRPRAGRRRAAHLLAARRARRASCGSSRRASPRSRAARAAS
jgi:class 3 adenylate cyclase